MSQKKWSPSTKLKLALEALKNDETIPDICQAHKVAPSQVHAWKKRLLDEGAKRFEGSSKQKIGELSVSYEG